MEDLDGALLAMRRGLMDKRRELKAGLAQLAGDIAAVDRVLAMRDPDYRPEATAANTPRQGKLPFAHGELTAAVLQTLHEAPQPLTAAECAQAMLAAKGVPDDLHASLVAQVASLLNHKASKGQAALPLTEWTDRAMARTRVRKLNLQLASTVPEVTLNSCLHSLSVQR